MHYSALTAEYQPLILIVNT